MRAYLARETLVSDIAEGRVVDTLSDLVGSSETGLVFEEVAGNFVEIRMGLLEVGVPVARVLGENAGARSH